MTAACPVSDFLGRLPLLFIVTCQAAVWRRVCTVSQTILVSPIITEDHDV